MFVEHLLRRSTLQEIAMVPPPGVVVVQPRVGFRLQLSEACEVTTMEGGPPALVEHDAVEASHTALWLGERGGVRWWTSLSLARCARRSTATSPADCLNGLDGFRIIPSRKSGVRGTRSTPRRAQA